MDMKNARTDLAATRGVGPETTDLERRVAAGEHDAGGDTGVETGADDVCVAERHGIWTVSAAGGFVGDYRDEEAARAAAAQARRREAGGGAGDPVQGAVVEARP